MAPTPLELLIDDTVDLGHRILGIDQLIRSLKSPELRDHYTEALNDLIMMYKEMSVRLEEELEKFVEEEKKQKLPINLEYRRILQSLRKK